MKVDRNDPLPMLITASKLFGGRLRHDSNSQGPYIRFGEPPFHVDLHRGDSIVKKGGKAVVTSIWAKQKLRIVKKNPDLHYLIDRVESAVKHTVDVSKKG